LYQGTQQVGVGRRGQPRDSDLMCQGSTILIEGRGEAARMRNIFDESSQSGGEAEGDETCRDDVKRTGVTG
jgi:hypothetical protein